MRRDSIGNDIQLGAVVRRKYQVIRIEERDDDPQALITLVPVTNDLVVIADLPQIQVPANAVLCESGPPEGWTPPEGDDKPGGGPKDDDPFPRGRLLPSAGDANDPYHVRDEHRRMNEQIRRKQERLRAQSSAGAEGGPKPPEASPEVSTATAPSPAEERPGESTGHPAAVTGAAPEAAPGQPATDPNGGEAPSVGGFGRGRKR